MSATNPFPLGIEQKQDSFEKLQLLANVDSTFKYTAEEYNKIIEAIEWLYQNSNTVIPNLSFYALKTINDLKSFNVSLNDTVSTLGYYSLGDNGGATYKIVSSSVYLDEFGLAITLNNGLIAENISVIKKASHFGVLPDETTNWEGLEGQRMEALYKASQYFKIHFEEGLYFTSMNITNIYKNVKMHFENSEFALLHLISSNSIIEDAGINTIIDEGSTLLIETTSNHGANTSRNISFLDTGTNLDGNSYLAEIVSANQLRIYVDDYSGVLNGGVLFDSPMSNVTLTGHWITYDRFGTINVDGLHGNLRITCKEDVSKNANGTGGRGVHVFASCKNFFLGKMTVEQAEDQITAPNNHAAVIIDGHVNGNDRTYPENINITEIEILDTRTNGVVINGLNHKIGKITIHKWGSNVVNIGSQLGFINSTDNHGELTNSFLSGVILADTNVQIGEIWVNQKDGFLNRNKALIDVMVARALLNEEYYYPTIGTINSLKPQREALTVGKTIRESLLRVGNINIGVIDNNNILNTNPTERANRGLIDLGLASVEIGQVTCIDNKNATIVQQLDYSYSGTTLRFVKAIFNTVQTPKIGVAGKIFNCEANAFCSNIIGFGQPYDRSTLMSGDLYITSLLNSDATKVLSTDPTGKIILVNKD